MEREQKMRDEREHEGDRQDKIARGRDTRRATRARERITKQKKASGDEKKTRVENWKQ